MKKRITILMALTAVMLVMFAGSAFAATYSDAWKQGADGVWHIYNPDGSMIRNAWICDDAGSGNLDTWYLIDADGNMVSSPLVQDGTGNYYSLEMDHNGYYGMLRYKNGNYNGIALAFVPEHNGSFAAISNADGLAALKAAYGVKNVSNINNSNIIYTSKLGSGSASGAQQKANTADLNSAWNTYRERIIPIFQSGYDLDGNPGVGWKERGSRTLVYCPMSGAVYFDAICVQWPESIADQSIFVQAEFSGEWSDMAMDIQDNPSNPFYRSLEPICEQMLNALLGNAEAAPLFAAIKAQADKTVTRELTRYYIDENGNPAITSLGYGTGGDGMNLENFDFSYWTNRTTADGFRYSVVSNGSNGFKILIYKN